VAQVRAQRDHVLGRGRALHEREQRRREARALLAGLDVREHAEEAAPSFRYRPVRLGLLPRCTNRPGPAAAGGGGLAMRGHEVRAGDVVRHHCGLKVTIGVDDEEAWFCDSLRCPMHDDDASAFAGWHVLDGPRWIEDEFPSLFADRWSKLPDELWDLGHLLGLKGADYALIGRIHRSQSRGGTAYPSHGDLARVLGAKFDPSADTKSNTVRRGIARLERLGCLNVRRPRRADGSRLSTEYDLRPLWRKLAALAAAQGTNTTPGPGDKYGPPGKRKDPGKSPYGVRRSEPGTAESDVDSIRHVLDQYEEENR
jgi:hypothetical protein